MATKKKEAATTQKATTQKYTYNYDIDNGDCGEYETGRGIVKATSPREAVAKALIKMSHRCIGCLDIGQSKGNPDEFELIDVDTEEDVTPVPDGADDWFGPWVATEQHLLRSKEWGNELKLEGAEIVTVDGTKVYFFVEDPGENEDGEEDEDFEISSDMEQTIKDIVADLTSPK